MKTIIIGALVVIMMMLVGCSSKSSNEGFEVISAKEAHQIIEENDDVIILDVRTEGEYKEGHIEGAINIPNETIGKDDIKELDNKDALILVYCRSGNRSNQAAGKLVDLGYSNVKDFGGISSWDYGVVK